MRQVRPVRDFLPLLSDLLHWWDAASIRGVVIGGVAVALLAQPRLTQDVDALVLVAEDRWPEFLALGERFGFVPRIDDALSFARRARVLLLRYAPAELDVDISFGALPFEEEAVRRALDVDLEGTHVPVPRPEHLLVMKAIAHRDRDRVDIGHLLDAHPQVDLSDAIATVRAFAELLDEPEIAADFESQVARHFRRRRDR